jgi:hypothetical protein
VSSVRPASNGCAKASTADNSSAAGAPSVTPAATDVAATIALAACWTAADRLLALARPRETAVA